MPYPNHSLLVMGGSWQPPELAAEIWTTSVRLTAGFTSAQDWPDVLAEASTKVQAWWGSPWTSDKATLEYVKLNPIGPDGRYAIEDETYVDFLETPLRGVNGGDLLPLQNSVVVTTLTGRTRGIASRGRMFLPGVMAFQIGPNGFLTVAAQQGMADSCAGFMGALSIWNGDFNGVPAVVSQGANGGAGEGAASPIIAVSVGNVVDTQRRRRNALTPEARITEGILPLP